MQLIISGDLSRGSDDARNLRLLLYHHRLHFVQSSSNFILLEGESVSFYLLYRRFCFPDSISLLLGVTNGTTWRLSGHERTIENGKNEDILISIKRHCYFKVWIQCHWGRFDYTNTDCVQMHVVHASFDPDALRASCDNYDPTSYLSILVHHRIILKFHQKCVKK